MKPAGSFAATFCGRSFKSDSSVSHLHERVHFAYEASVALEFGFVDSQGEVYFGGGFRAFE